MISIHYWKLTGEVEMCKHFLEWQKQECCIIEETGCAPDHPHGNMPVITNDGKNVIAVGFEGLFDYFRKRGIVLY